MRSVKISQFSVRPIGAKQIFTGQRESLSAAICVIEWSVHELSMTEKSGSDLPVIIQQVQKLLYTRGKSEHWYPPLWLHVNAVCGLEGWPNKKGLSQHIRGDQFAKLGQLCSVVCVITAYSAPIDASKWSTKHDMMKLAENITKH